MESHHLTWAREIFVGTSGYTSKATPELMGRKSSQSALTSSRQKLSEALARDGPSGIARIYDSKNYLYYYRLTPDHRMLFGGRAAFFPESEDSIRRSAELLRRGMIEVYPQLPRYKSGILLGRNARLRV